ncbi:ABC transporter permease [Spiroplasma chrysopicola]|uniref:ABC3 transporter permease C-terminal domain-containing protein n=1 Tax=Spiroplasma chrysopicola DF-1 TaxID=1276227 RepID=R4U2H2_9MOLU|nr:ABC transporter permease [Spiroplasma chrysopicola]AGM25572.1 hypothetical protein SCHRY_v1c10000 [Spiroplasma chrysopicola DF-1]
MKNLVKEATRGFTKKITQLIGLILFIITAVMTFTALFSAVFQVQNGINNLAKQSGSYDYEINLTSLYVDNNVIKKGDNEINLANRTFLEFFYDSTAIDNLELNFNTIKSDLGKLECSKDDGLCQWTKAPSYLNPSTGTAAFTTLAKNFNQNLESLLLSYLFNNQGKSFLESNNLSAQIAFSLNYQFVIKDLSAQNQYFNATPIAKNFDEMYYGDDWMNLNMFTSSFNRVYDSYHQKVVNNTPTRTVYLTQQYGQYKNLAVGDSFNLLDSVGLQYQIKGWASRYSTIYPNLASLAVIANQKESVSLKNGSLLFLNDDDYNQIKYNFGTGTEIMTAFIKMEGSPNFAQKTEVLSNLLSKNFISPDNAIFDFNSTYAGDTVMLANTTFIIDGSIAFACSIIIIFIIAFFIKKDIHMQKKQIGVLKALGYGRHQLSIVFIINIALATLIGCLIGWVLSMPFQMYFTASNLYSIGISLTLFYFNPLIFIITILVIPLCFAILAFIISYSLLKNSALDLIYDLKATNLHVRYKKVKKAKRYYHLGLSFNAHLSFTFALKSLGKWIMVMVVLAFASFLLIFQLDADVMAQKFVKDSFRYFKDDIKSYLIASYDQQEIAVQSQNKESYQWINQDQVEQYYHQADILEDSTKFNFPNPLTCLMTLTSTGKGCGDFLNIIGNINKTDYHSKIRVVDGKYPYLSSQTVEALVDYQMLGNNGQLVNGWNRIKEMLENPLYQEILINQGNLTKGDIQAAIGVVNLIRNIKTLTDGNYPDVYFGPYMVYNPKYDFPYISSPARWQASDVANAKNPITRLGLVGLSNNRSEREQLFNFKSKKLSLDDLQEQVFGYDINPNPLQISDLNKAINEPIPVILSTRLYQAMQAQPGQIFTLKAQITNTIGYVPIAFKIVGDNLGDINSANIYMNKNSLVRVMNQWVKITGKGEIFDDNNYNNAIASKKSKNGSVLQPYRIISSYSLTNNYDFTMYNEQKKLDPTRVADLRANLKVLNNFNRIFPFDMLRESYQEGMKTVSEILTVLEGLTILIVALILAVLIGMVLDENRRTILTMKVLGYPTHKIILIVLGFYFFAILIGYAASFGLAQIAWWIILKVLFMQNGLLIIPEFSLSVVLYASLAIGIILCTIVSLGIWQIKRNALTNITMY